MSTNGRRVHNALPPLRRQGEKYCLTKKQKTLPEYVQQQIQQLKNTFLTRTSLPAGS